VEKYVFRASVKSVLVLPSLTLMAISSESVVDLAEHPGDVQYRSVITPTSKSPFKRWAFAIALPSPSSTASTKPQNAKKASSW
jgi:hypothetical protein